MLFDALLLGVKIMMDNERPEYFRIITVQFNKKVKIYSNVPMYSSNKKTEDTKNAKDYCRHNRYRFVKLGECVTDAEYVERGKKDCNWYKFNAL